MNYSRTTFERPLEIELIRSMNHRILTKKEEKTLDRLLEPPPDSKDAFIIRKAAEWVNEGRQQQQDTLFGDFWYRHELCILFADTNVGKSILAVQIGDSLSKGQPMPEFGGSSTPEKVLYFDFELSAQQFGKRYSSNTYGIYPFDDNFYRVVLNPYSTSAKKFATYADYINNAIENAIISTGARNLIIDNITCLRTGTEAAAAAVSLMRNLQNIKTQYALSILVLAHTPKRNPAKPVTRNDLQGSKMLINFADSAFAIGESQTTSGLRYLKQIKQRSGQEIYGAGNVCLCRIVKPYNFLKFEFEANAAEALHLTPYTEQQRRHTENHIAQLHARGMSLGQIAAETNMPKATVFRIVKRVSEVEG
ncbi:AAA family ATPase [Mucilaginibacter auburnensis]|uniref:IclR-like helix-turn-helix domain-containing protein n=1 Tax=Mucilaginibacter auburnensis TaxID=1457233 RepID=A0A2H9VLJ8_9SPHI|nr:AAA family ATPase [Mucilaginibacter auburnensis]PJJ79219.1 IclR-like helix-turn-helix domain-containing protein [Mucilaginibacter auburnensis]